MLLRVAVVNYSLTVLQIATQPSIWDSENLEEYKDLYIHPEWENWNAFDPAFRWTWREERAVRRKVDWKIMVCNAYKNPSVILC